MIKRFANKYEFCDEDVNFLLVNWKRFDETFLLDKDTFCSSLNMKEITDVDYRHAKRVFKDFNNKNIGDYRDLYVQSETFLLADVFENFRNMCLKIYELDPAHFLPAPGLVWEACLINKIINRY